LFGKELVKKGIRWGIGDDLHTRILSDNWIPRFTPDRVKTIVHVPLNPTVSILIDADSRSWDSEAVTSIFEDIIASKILQIPLSRHGYDDIPTWTYAKFGVYTVK
jgi:hypothetical protein